MAIAELPAAKTPPRSWRKLHASNWLAVIVCLAVLLLANLSGYVCWEWERQETGKPYAWHHGWPWTFLQRDGAPDPVFGSPTFDRDLWALNRRVLDVDPLALVGNVAVGLGLTVLFAGGLEWRRRRRSRLLQLTISDLAGVTFVVAAVLGYGTWRYRNWELQAAALSASTFWIERGYLLGVDVNAGTPEWIRQRLGGERFRPFDRVAQIEFDWYDSQTAPMEGLRDLPSLVLYEKPRDPTQLSAFRNLLHLEIDSHAATDVVLRQFADCRQLQTLSIQRSTGITVEGLQHLRELTALEVLAIDVSRTEDASATSEADFQWLDGMSRLRSLDMPAWHIPDGTLERIGAFRALLALDLSNTLITDAGIAHLDGLNALQSLDLSHTAVADAGLQAIGRLENLSDLQLDETQVGDDGLRQIAGLTKLYELTLNGTLISDAGLVHLEGLPNLKFLELQRTEVSEAAVNRLRAKLPNAVVVFTPKTPP